MTLYAILHKPSGHFLPHAKRGEHAAPQTHAEPNEYDPPRLFATKVGAQRALRCWLKGRIRYGRAKTYPNAISYRLEYVQPVVRWFYEPVESRRAEDMEVVEIELTVKGA